MTARAIARFTIRNETPAAYQDEVVTCGVPMKQGVAPAGTVLGVADASGAAIGEAVASATWADGSAKWAAVTIPAFSLAAGKKATVAVTRLDAPPPSRIRLMRKTNGLAVNNGQMRFRIATTGAIISTLDELTAAGWRRRARDLDLRMRVGG